MKLMVVCTANQCRSPMAEVIARAGMHRRGIAGKVTSAGTMAVEGAPATDEAKATVERFGLDLSGHESRPVTAELVADSDLVVGMEHDHVLKLVTDHAAPLHRTYTLPDLARLAAEAGPRAPGEPLDDWLQRVGAGRPPQAVLGGSRDTEIADPIGRSKKHYRIAAQQISDALDIVLDLLH